MPKPGGDQRDIFGEVMPVLPVGDAVCDRPEVQSARRISFGAHFIGSGSRRSAEYRADHPIEDILVGLELIDEILPSEDEHAITQ